jgi:hypothetical protein
MTSGKVDLNGWPVWYEKFGTGSEVVLLIPGAMGMSDVTNLKISVINIVL